MNEEITITKEEVLEVCTQLASFIDREYGDHEWCAESIITGFVLWEFQKRFNKKIEKNKRNK